MIYKNIKSKTLVSPQVIFAEQQLALGIKFVSIYAVLFMPALEEQILSKIKKKLSVWQKHIGDVLFTWNYGEEPLKEFINEINLFHPTIKYSVD